jgi:hypothetical protein
LVKEIKACTKQLVKTDAKYAKEMIIKKNWMTMKKYYNKKI